MAGDRERCRGRGAGDVWPVLPWAVGTVTGPEGKREAEAEAEADAEAEAEADGIVSGS